MSSIFIGRLPLYNFDDRDLEGLFDKFGKITDIKMKRGLNFAFGFITYKYKEDAYDAMDKMNGRTIDGIAIVVEKKHDTPGQKSDYCYCCGDSYHYVRDCPHKRHYYEDVSYGRGGRGRRRDSYDDDRYSRYRSRSRSPSYDRRRGRGLSRSPSRSPSRRRDDSPDSNGYSRAHSSTSSNSDAAAKVKSSVYYYKK